MATSETMSKEGMIGSCVHIKARNLSEKSPILNGSRC
jgi:hypothetical protein